MINGKKKAVKNINFEWGLNGFIRRNAR
jgi:hypothetical protein